MMTYTCGECGAPVNCHQVDGEVVFTRTCEHKEAAVIAHLEATVYGESKVE